MGWRRFVGLAVLAAISQLCGCATKMRDQPLVLESASDPGAPTVLNTETNTYLVMVKAQVAWRSGALWHQIGAPAAGNYRLLAYEKDKGFAPLVVRTTRELQPRTKNELRDGFMQGAAPGILAFAIVTSPFWGPFYLAARPKDLPAGGFFWIEDADTGEVIYGRSPWALADPGRKVPDAPAPPGETWVNCAVNGQRTWTWRNICDP